MEPYGVWLVLGYVLGVLTVAVMAAAIWHDHH